MSGAEARERLDEAVRDALGKAYRYGLVSMAVAGSGGARLGYPEAEAEAAKVMAAADACADAKVTVTWGAPGVPDGRG